MGQITLEQVAEILNLILKANVTGETVQKTLIERFDLVEAMMRHPDAVKAMNPSLFEAFLVSSVHPQMWLFETPPVKVEEEFVSEYGYPAGWRLKAVEAQLAILDDFFPGLTLKAEVPASLPEGAEGWLLAPKPSKIANTYNEALSKLLSLITGVSPSFVNPRKERLGPEHLRPAERTNQVLDKLEHSTPGDYLVLAIQCGLQYRAKSVSQARQAFRETEYGLGPFEVASLLLIHPERLTAYEHLGIDCPGGEYAANAGGDFHYALCFNWSEGGLYLDCSSVEGIAPGFGSASGFVE